MGEFGNQNDLRRLLLTKGIDTSNWGTGDAKTVNDLWNEIIRGDSSIQIEPLLRLVDVVQIVIRNGSKVLIEARQDLQDGRIRLRDILPSEKKRPNETYVETAKRGIKEEMQIDEKDIEILESTHKQKQEIEESISYPGLRTLYRYDIVEAKISGLPKIDFWSYEKRNDQDPVIKHQWVWKSQNTGK